jgi:hypothetical protein
MRAFLLFVILVPGFVSCQNRTGFDNSIFEMGVSKGLLTNPMLTEVSGLVASVENPGMFWVNNDSGDAPQIYLIDSAANLLAIVRLKGVQNRDWEEIAIGPGPDSTANYIYIGEIGDNLSQYPTKSIFRIKDFKVPTAEAVFDTLISEVDHLEFTLPDGPRDSEAMVVDPISKNIFLFSKREEKINLYEIKNWPSGKVTAQAMLLRQLPFTQITAADISADGTELIIRNYKAILYWKRDTTQPFVSVFDKEQSVLPYSQEPQGEAVAFDISGKGYYTVSEFAEGKTPHLIFYKRKNQ